MSTRSTNLVILGILVGSLVVGALAYPRLPANVATHWNAAGEPDGYGSPLVAVALLPVTVGILYLLFLVVPRIDPLKENIAEFRPAFNGFIVAVVAFMAYIFGLSLAWNLGLTFDMGRAMAPALGTLFYISGMLIARARPNWFIGIRTPWTLSNETVWTRTHRLGAVLFKLLGVLAFAGVLLPGEWALVLILVPALFIVVWSFGYSYFAYVQETRAEEAGGRAGA